MSAKVEIIHTAGPFGDETSMYEVVTDATTVGEFIDSILSKYKYQTFCLRADKERPDGDVCMAYAQDGAILRKASQYDTMRTFKPKKIIANGGYGNLNFYISVDGKPPKQNLSEFQIIYWGHTF